MFARFLFTAYFISRSSVPNFTPIGATIKVYDTKNLNVYWDLIKMWNINAPQGRPSVSLARFH